MTGARRPPDLLVEQLALGELDPARADAVRAELAREAGETGHDRLAELERSNLEILADYPPERIAGEILRRHAREPQAPRRRSPALWLLIPSLAAAAVIVWVVVQPEPELTVGQREPVPTTSAGSPEQPPDTIRIKGGVDPHLVIDRQLATGHERLTDGEAVHAGDLVQVSYVPAGRREGVILSFDGAGVVTLHHPPAPELPPSLAVGEEVPLAHAYELDAAPKFERFVFVTRDEGPISVAEILAAAEQLAAKPEQAESQPLALPGAGWIQHSLTLRKLAGPAGGP